MFKIDWNEQTEYSKYTVYINQTNLIEQTEYIDQINNNDLDVQTDSSIIQLCLTVHTKVMIDKDLRLNFGPVLYTSC